MAKGNRLHILLGYKISRQKFGESPCMGLGCGTPTSFMPVATTLMAQGITPAFKYWD